MVRTFSIITPSFNQGRFLDDAISSVLSQSGDFFIDYIIVDGGSEDESVSVIGKYDRLLREHCTTERRDGLTFHVRKESSFDLCNCRGISYRWISEKDNGQSHAINKGISLMAGDCFAWLNSDDYYTGTDVFAGVMDFFNANPGTDMLYGRGYCADEHKNIFRDFHDNCTTLAFSLRVLRHECFILQPAVFIRSGAVRAAGPIDESLHWAMDWDCWLRVARKHTITFFPRWIACFRQYEGIKTLQFNAKKLAERDRILRKYSGPAQYVMNRWYHQATMFSLWRLASLRHGFPPVRAAVFLAEKGINLLLMVLVRLFGRRKSGGPVKRVALFMPAGPDSAGATALGTEFTRRLANSDQGTFTDVYADGDLTRLRPESPRWRVLNCRNFYRNHYVYSSILYIIGDDYPANSFMFPFLRRFGGTVKLDNPRLTRTYAAILGEMKAALKKGKLLRLLRVCLAYPETRYFAWYRLSNLLLKRDRELYLDRNLYRKSFAVRKAESIIIGDRDQVRHYRLPAGKCEILSREPDLSTGGV